MKLNRRTRTRQEPENLSKQEKIKTRLKGKNSVISRMRLRLKEKLDKNLDLWKPFDNSFLTLTLSKNKQFHPFYVFAMFSY